MSQLPHRSPTTTRNATALRRWFVLVVSTVMLLSALPSSLVEPAAAQSDGSSFTIAVQKYNCPPGFDAYSGQGLFDNCTDPQPGVPFTVTTDNGYYVNETRHTGDDGGSAVSWADIPLETSFILQEEIPEGYGLPMIGCAAYAEPWNFGAGTVNPSFSYGQGNISAYLDSSYSDYPYIDCYWFNVPLPNGQGTGDNGYGTQENPGSIYIKKYICWDYYGSYDPHSNGVLDTLRQNCQAGLPGTRFGILLPAEETPESVPTNDGGEALFEGYEGGQIFITEQEPYWPNPQRSYVYCAPYTDPNQSPTWEYKQLQDGTVQYDLDPGYSITCEWYNFFEPSIDIVKYTCGDDRDYRQSDLGELLRYCHVAEGFDYTIESEGQSTAQETTDQGGRISVTLDHSEESDQPEGYQTGIHEDDASGYPYQRIFCSIVEPGEYPEPASEHSLESDGWLRYVQARYSQLACAWFNIEDYDNGDTYGTVTIYKLYCDEGYDGSSTYHQDYIDDCYEHDDVEFDLFGSGNYDESQTVANGYAQWDKTVPYGDLTITERPPSGYATWRVFCGTYQDDPSEVATYDPVTYSGNSVNWELDEGWNLICYWINYPSDDYYGTVTIYKLYCDEGYDGSSTYHQDYIDDCYEHDGVEFDLFGSGNYDESQTVANGYAQWDKSVPYGDLTITERPPTGYATWRVFCGTYQDDPSEVATYDPVQYSGNSIDWELDEGWNLICYWINYPSDDYYGTVTIYKLYCDEGYDGSSTYHQDYIDDCYEHDGVEFDLFGTGNYDESQTVANGYAQWDKSVPYGDLTITERPPSGYATWRVFCGTYQDDPSEVATYDPVTYSGDSIDWELDEGWNLICYWINYPYEDEYGDITIYKWYCDEGYDEHNLTLGYLQSWCYLAPDYPFHLSDYPSGEDTKSSDSGGAIYWDQVPAGEHAIQELADTVYQPLSIYCTTFPDGAPEGDYEDYNWSQDWSLDYVVQPGYHVICHWFNRGYYDNTEITIYKYACDEGYDHHNIGREYLASYCTEAHEGVEFELGYEGGSENGTTDSSGEVTWSDIPGGPVTVTEYAPSDYKTLRVYCSVYERSSGSPEDWERKTVSGGGKISHHIPYGYDLVCYWFNEPYEDDHHGKVTIYKYTCPDGVDYSNLSQGYLESYCPDYTPGIDYTLEWNGSSESLATADDGSVEWDSVEGGSLKLIETLPQGYTTIAIYCAAYPSEGSISSLDSVPVYEGHYAFYRLPEGYSLLCFWYDAPAEHPWGDVTIYKYVCPEGFDATSASREYLESSCSEPHGSVEFRLENEIGTIPPKGGVIFTPTGDEEPLVTDANGFIQWEQVYWGGIQLHEVVPEGYEVLRVYCSAYPVDDAPVTYEAMAISGGETVYYDLPYGHSLTCYWYNTPQTGGYVWITKYWCHDGYDPSHAGYHDLAYDCSGTLSDVEYSAEPKEGSGGDSGSTDANGEVTLTGLKYDEPYDIQERYPSGYNYSIVYCARYSPAYIATGEYKPYAVWNGKITVTLEHGEYLICSWFNLANKYGVDVHITKYYCEPAAWEYDEHELYSECTDWAPHVKFYAWSGGNSYSGTTGNDGEVFWEGLPSGVVKVEELPPDGYGNRIRVYCTVVTGDEPGESESAHVQDGTAIEYGLHDGQRLECKWFNFPVDDHGGKVVVYKYLCHAGVHASSSRSSLKSKCAPLDGIRFSLAASGQQAQTRITGDTGKAQWEAVPAGEIGLAERTTTGYETPIVYCSLNQGDWSRALTSAGGIEYEIHDQDQLWCEWFNVPKSGTSSGESGGSGGTGGTGGNQTTGEGPATLTIVKYICPAGYDLYDEEADPTDECEAYEESISFTLQGWGADSDFDEVTVESEEPLINVVSFEDLEAGDYLVTEIPPVDPEIAWAFVLSCESSLGELDSTRFYPLALTGDNLSLRLTLYAGEELSCGWYNVPVGGNVLTVTVFECPGRLPNPARCTLAGEGVDLFFTPVDAIGATVEATTDEDGVAVAQLAAGLYEVDNDDGTVCLVDSTAVDDDGNITIEDGEEVEAVIYTCAA